ncbi:MAG: NADH-quinone oxidoreductase subunit K [Candidatus Omnitrophica bacterium]|jgi:multisubunit Na+/H+ antiporter MnhC subunit|nr:NADH-quinone oxidoreductase subunit K [Candidatus Omnitrophota bacterium]MDD5513265.1 NADH-quinone oxidoreductase subunit K [Candidatus Omnitrophota bacterium]
MTAQALSLFWPYCIFIIMLVIIGLYCMLVTYNLIRALIGLELLIKAITLFLILAGYISGHPVMTQALVITLIVIEVVVIVVATGVVLNLHRQNQSLDVRKLRTIKD